MWFDEIPWDGMASSRSSNSDSKVKQTFKFKNVKIHPILVLLSFTLLFPKKTNDEASVKKSQLIVCDTHQRWIGRGLHYRFSWHWSHYRFIWRSMFFTHAIEQRFWRKQIKFCIVQIDLAYGQGFRPFPICICLLYFCPVAFIFCSKLHGPRHHGERDHGQRHHGRR